MRFEETNSPLTPPPLPRSYPPPYPANPPPPPTFHRYTVTFEEIERLKNCTLPPHKPLPPRNLLPPRKRKRLGFAAAMRKQLEGV